MQHMYTATKAPQSLYTVTLQNQISMNRGDWIEPSHTLVASLVRTVCYYPIRAYFFVELATYRKWGRRLIIFGAVFTVLYRVSPQSWD